jgi:hypothetical protein
MTPDLSIHRRTFLARSGLEKGVSHLFRGEKGG